MSDEQVDHPEQGDFVPRRQLALDQPAHDRRRRGRQRSQALAHHLAATTAGCILIKEERLVLLTQDAHRAEGGFAGETGRVRVDQQAGRMEPR